MNQKKFQELSRKKTGRDYAVTGIRPQKVASLLHRELAPILYRKNYRAPSKEGMFCDFTVSDVIVSNDLRYAEIFLSFLPRMSDDMRSATIDNLMSLTPFFRKHLSRKMGLKMIPRLKFSYDDTMDKVANLNELISKAVAMDSDTDING